jgi:hypothetical protein
MQSGAISPSEYAPTFDADCCMAPSEDGALNLAPLRRLLNSARMIAMRFVVLTASFFLILCVEASARPRDEVMINAYRCAGQAASRAWLDCYYGAAQPQRAALGMEPAPASQQQLIQASPPPEAPQDIAVRDTVMAAAARCASVSAERPWLDCYYASANPMRTILGLAPMQGPIVPVPAGSVLPPARHKKTGILEAILGDRDVAMSARMEAYHFDRNGIFTVTLENGDVWRQIDGDSNFAHWSKEPHSYLVTISNGAFKSFNLAVKGSPASYKVRRVS